MNLSRGHRDVLPGARGAAPLPIPITQDSHQRNPDILTELSLGTSTTKTRGYSCSHSYELAPNSTDTLTWIHCPQLQICISLQPLQMRIYSSTHAHANNSPGTSQTKPSPRALHPGLRALLQCCIASTAGKELFNFTKKHFSFCLRL